MSEATLAAILDSADEGIVAFGADGNCSFVGRRIGELFGVDQGLLVGAPQRDVIELLASACEEPEQLRELATAAAGPAMQSVDLELHRPTLRMLRLRTSPVAGDRAGSGWVLLARDLTKERSAERRAQQLLTRLEHLTATDAITQLPNRRRFLEELDREHGRAQRAWDSYAVLRIDVDGLGNLNAELGQVRGDEVLEHVAAKLREGRREYDLLARFEQDEFVLLLPGADAHAATVVGERIVASVRKDPLALDGPRRITVSVGGAVWVPPTGEMGPDVVRRAGDALAVAKRGGPASLRIDVVDPNKASTTPE
jgi:diguanylate cyclase (GGDEF)-like protein/PAS domain S-box-containing protein